MKMGKTIKISFYLPILVFVSIPAYLFADENKAPHPEKNQINRLTVASLDRLPAEHPELRRMPDGSTIKTWHDGQGRDITLNETVTAVPMPDLLTDEVLGSKTKRTKRITLADGTQALYYADEIDSGGKQVKFHNVAWSKPAQWNGRVEGAPATYYSFILSFTEGFSEQEVLDIVNHITYTEEEAELKSPG